MKTLLLLIAIVVTASISGCYSSNTSTSGNTDAAITSFSINGVPAKITGHYISVTLPRGTNIKSAVAKIVHNGVDVTVNGGKYKQNKLYDFTNVVNYDVIKADGSKVHYQLRATVALNKVYLVGANRNNIYNGEGNGLAFVYDSTGSVSNPGVLTHAVISFLPTLTVSYPVQVTADKSGKYLYVVNNSFFNKYGVDIYEISNTGLNLISSVLDGENILPNGNLVLDPNYNNVFYINGANNDNFLLGYKIDESHNIEQLSKKKIPQNTSGILTIDQSGKHLYSTYATSSPFQQMMSIYGINEDLSINTPANNFQLQVPTLINDMALVQNSSLGVDNAYITSGSNGSYQGQIWVNQVKDGSLKFELGALSTFQYYPGLVLADPNGKYVYVATNSMPGFGNSNYAILMYKIDQVDYVTLEPVNQGDKISVVQLDSIPTGMVVDSSGKYLFVQTTQNLSAYTIMDNGSLKLFDKIIIDPSYASQFKLSRYLTLRDDSSGENKILYLAIVHDNAASGTPQSIVQYNFNLKTQKLNRAGQIIAINTDGQFPQDITLEPSNHYAYILNTDINSISMYSIDQSSGNLLPLSTKTISTVNNPIKMIFNSSEQYAYVLGNNSIAAYNVELTGGLSKIDGGNIVDNRVRFTDIALYSLGDSSYVYASTGSKILVYKINEASGKLEFKYNFPITSTSNKYNSTKIVFNGQYAYVTSYTSNSVFIYEVQQKGSLKLLNQISSVSNPINIAFDPTGKYAYVVNYGEDGEVSMYKVQSNGLLKANGVIRNIRNPSGLKFDASGKYVYVTSSGFSSVSMYKLDQASGVLSEISKPITTNVIMDGDNALATN